jgi:integrase
MMTKKRAQPRFVPVVSQAVAILRELYPVTGFAQYVFPSVRTKTKLMSENTVNGRLRWLGLTGDEIGGLKSEAADC